MSRNLTRRIKILHEDDRLLAFDKPSGLPSAPQARSKLETATDQALEHCPDLKNTFPNSKEPGLLHRLDTETSGILLFAKTSSTYERVRAHWEKHQMIKTYRALVNGAPHTRFFKTPLTITLPLAHSAKSAKKMIVLDPAKRFSLRASSRRGKSLEAITHIQKATLLEKSLFDLTLQIETGVMHQIRCHLQNIGWPIYGDSHYKGTPSTRLWLHAWKLECPVLDFFPKLEAALPQDWPTHVEDAISSVDDKS